MQNLQADSAVVERVAAAYGLACRLTGHLVRPSGKPFVAHLVGTAGALVRWSQPAEVVLAGLLHSAYLFGDFRDGSFGATPRRRRWLREFLGERAESLVAAVASDAWRQPLDRHVAAAESSAASRDLLIVKLADCLDELADGGPRYCPHKRQSPNELESEESWRQASLAAGRFISPEAAADLSAAIEVWRRTAPPPGLIANARSAYQQLQGVPELRRSAVTRKLVRLRRRLFSHRAA
jgi:hypothetical protein